MLALSAAIGVGVAAGCGGDGDGSSDVSTGIAPSKLLSDVTAEEAASACENLRVGFQRVFSGAALIRSICTLTSAAAVETTAECNTLRDECIEAASMQDSELTSGLDDIEFDCEGELAFDECTGTVGQLEVCVNDVLAAVNAAFNQYSCNDAAAVEGEDLEGFIDGAFATPASCEVVGCPGGTPFEPDEPE